MKEIERISIVKNGIKEIGFFDDDRNFIKADDILNHLMLDVFQSICELREQEERTEIKNIELEISSLNAMANAVNALSNYSKIF